MPLIWTYRLRAVGVVSWTYGRIWRRGLLKPIGQARPLDHLYGQVSAAIAERTFQ